MLRSTSNRWLIGLCSWFIAGAGCDVGGSSSAGGGDSSGGGGEGASDVNACAPVDCSDTANSSFPECSSSPDPGVLGNGPSFYGSSPEVGPGFMEGSTIFLTVKPSSSGDGALFSIDVTTGDRTWISGVWEDPQLGTQTRGAGPDFGTPLDVARGPDGLYVMVNSDLGRQLLIVDEVTGDRVQAMNLAEPPCQVGTENVLMNPELEVDSDGTVLVLGSVLGSAGLFRLDVGADTCAAVSFASADEHRLGSGPEFYNFQSLDLADGVAYTNNSSTNSLVAIDLATGNRTRVSSSSSATPVGEGPGAGQNSIQVEPGLVRAARGNAGSDVLVDIDLATGDRTAIFSKGGPAFNTSAPWLYGSRDGCYYLGDRAAVIAFHPPSGLSNTISR